MFAWNHSLIAASAATIRIKTNQSNVIVFFVVVVCLHALMNDYYLLCAPLFLTHRRKNTIPKRLTDRRGKIRPFTETSSFRKTQVSIRIHGTTLLLFYIVAILLLFTTAACLVTTGTGWGNHQTLQYITSYIDGTGQLGRRWLIVVAASCITSKRQL